MAMAMSVPSYKHYTSLAMVAPWVPSQIVVAESGVRALLGTYLFIGKG